MKEPRRLGKVTSDPKATRIETTEVVERGLVLLELQHARIGLDRRLEVLGAQRNLPQHKERPHGLLLAHRLVVMVPVMACMVMVMVPVPSVMAVGLVPRKGLALRAALALCMTHLRLVCVHRDPRSLPTFRHHHDAKGCLLQGAAFGAA